MSSRGSPTPGCPCPDQYGEMSPQESPCYQLTPGASDLPSWARSPAPQQQRARRGWDQSSSACPTTQGQQALPNWARRNDPGPSSRPRTYPGQYVGPTPQETPGHRMSRPPSPPQYFNYSMEEPYDYDSSPDSCPESSPRSYHDSSSGSCPDSFEEPTPYNTPGHRMNRPPSPPRVFTYDGYCEEPTPYTTPGHRMNRPPSPPSVFTYDVPSPGSGYSAESSVDSSCPTDTTSSSRYYTAQSSLANTSSSTYSQCPSRGRSQRVPLAQSSPTGCPRGYRQQGGSYSPGFSPVSSRSPASQNTTFDTGCPNATFDAGCPNATFDAGCPNATFDAGCPNATFDVGRGNDTTIWTWEEYQEVFGDNTLEDDVFEPPECPRTKRRPPPLTIREELNETFTMQVPGQGFMQANTQQDCPQNTTFEMDCPQNATFEMSSPYDTTTSSSSSRAELGDCLAQRIEESQERVRGIIDKMKTMIAEHKCDRGYLNKRFSREPDDPD